MTPLANGAGVHPDEDQRRSSFRRPSALDPVQQPGGPVIGGVTQHHAGTYPEQLFGRGVNVYEAYIKEFASHALGA